MALAAPETQWAVLATEPESFLAGPLAGLPVLAAVSAAARRRAGAVAGRKTAAAAPALQRSDLTGLDPGTQRSRLVEFLSAEIGRAVGVDPSTLDPDRSTDQLGIDSLVVVELRNRIKASLQVEIPASFFFEFPPIGAIAERLRESLEAGAPVEAGEAPGEGAAATPTSAEVDEMSGEDVDALLAQLLSEGQG
jgi:acyl carrier protein